MTIDAPFCLVAVGTDSHPFDRLIGWAEHLAQRLAPLPVLVQYGSSTPPRPPAIGVELFTRARFGEVLQAATVVILQGGPAGILEARSRGVLPLVVARDPALGEHVDEHQLLHLPSFVVDGHAVAIETSAQLEREVSVRIADPSLGRTAPVARSTEQAAVRFGAALQAAVQRKPGRRLRSGRRSS